MSQTGSYQFEKLESRHIESEYLAERAGLRLEGFVDLLKRHRFPEQGTVLEVGTGHGIRARLIADSFPRVEVTAIDRSPELLALARHGRRRNLGFLEADLYDLPFADNSFDFVYARLVFMHLSDPLRALLSLKRVLRPGGRILIEDADRDCMFFEPRPVTFVAFWCQVQEGQRRLGGDPNVGRKLAPFLKQLGLSQINVEVQNILGGAEEIAMLARTLMPSLNTYLEPEARASGEVAIADLQALASDPRATFYHFWFAVSGAKPDSTLG